MILKRQLDQLSESNQLKSIETITYHKTTIVEIKEYFSFLKKNDFIRDCEFEDVLWHLPDENKDRDIIFTFDIEIYKELNLALKGYILLKRISGKTVGTCFSLYRHLRRAIINSEGFCDLEKLETHLLSSTPLTAHNIATIISNFLLYYETPQLKELKTLCERIAKPERKNRNLPSFQDVLLFDDHLINHFKTSPSEDRIRFYPIYIWWKLTNVIPMHVIEFIKLSRNCVIRKEDGSYWITLPREKKRADSPFKIDVTDTVQVNEEIFELINEYTQLLDNLEIDSDYLIPYDLYIRFLQRPSGSSSQRKGTRNRLIDKYLQRMIDDFYVEIIGDTALDRVTCGDTRHFAMMNMFLQGFNMLSIARMAGHERLETQINYYSHASHYAESQVYLLSKKKYENSLNIKLGEGLIGRSRKYVDKGFLYSDSALGQLRKVDFGYCLDTDFPKNCVEDCRVCEPFYIFKPPVNEIDEGLKWLTDRSKAIQQETQEVVDYMFGVSQTMFYDYSKVTHQKTGQATLTSASMKLTQLMDQRATIEARLMEYEYDKE